ncbi:PLP-dependent aminotransferase family protein [Anaerotalea alkaliphila]|uniref:PLP-dependent aminotransferase family protein n=1 Tax=Anaerotalea alkaliphila TaxID=2662126 RepID=A0A7X5KMH0_9FIRM|nr:PLP-dependent aminotransferase family protein [Anaerotalea alkaliphila]NDL67981.1 PLP-dependent aminotransferase family protein [Anaerotalea alkaliphila]
MDMEPLLDAAIPSGGPKYLLLYETIRQEILSGKRAEHTRLPSIRETVRALGVSKTTVENAYNQLLMEGYIYSMPQKGYFASPMELDFAGQGNVAAKAATVPPPTGNMPAVLYDFQTEHLEEEGFNFDHWKKHMNLVLNYQSRALLRYGDPLGEESLKREVAQYLKRTRGIDADQNLMVVGAGVEPLLQNLAYLFGKKGFGSLAIEDPGFNRAKLSFETAGFELIPIPMGEGGLDVDLLVGTRSRLCYISPSHQFPTGRVMPVSLRRRLLRWAEDVDGYLIEDDYNTELRYTGRPIPALKGLDTQERVIYLGSFSTVLAPAFRLSFILLPPGLMEDFRECNGKKAQTASTLEQLTLASFMASGDYERLVRRVRKFFSKKQERLIRLLETHLEGEVEILESDGGLNLLLQTSAGIDLERLRETCRQKGLAFGTLGDYSLRPGGDTQVMVLGFRGIPEERMEAGIRLLGEVFRRHSAENVV